MSTAPALSFSASATVVEYFSALALVFWLVVGYNTQGGKSHVRQLVLLICVASHRCQSGLDPAVRLHWTITYQAPSLTVW